MPGEANKYGRYKHGKGQEKRKVFHSTGLGVVGFKEIYNPARRVSLNGLHCGEYNGVVSFFILELSKKEMNMIPGVLTFPLF